MDVVINRTSLESPVIAPSGEQAWSATSVGEIMQQAIDNGWLVLGGDVITDKGQYTYDNWYYNPNPNICKKDNIALSVHQCLDYVNTYINRNRGQFYFVLVLTPTM